MNQVAGTRIDFYKRAYFEYNISMKVKRKPKPIEKLRRHLNSHNGILFTSDLTELGIPRTYLSILQKNGEVQRVSRGLYSVANNLIDEMAVLQLRYKTAIFSHETALYLLGLTDRSPLFYSVTFPAGYNATLLKASGVKVYFVNRALVQLGSITIKSPNGNDIKTFNLERTVCDVVRSRNQMDIQFLNETLKKYVARRERNIDRLYDYAIKFRVQKIIREYIEVLL